MSKIFLNKNKKDINIANPNKKESVSNRKFHYTGIQQKEKIEKKKSLSWVDKLNKIGTVPQKEVVEFTRHIAVMLGAGVTIFETVNFLREQTKNKIFKDRLSNIIDDLNNGQSLSYAMSKYEKIFPSIYTHIVQVGEQSGTLSKTMSDLADHMEDTERFKKKVKGALIYPKIIITVMLGFMLILVLFVMPRILNVFNSLGAEIPLATRILIGSTNFINKYIFLLGFLAFLFYLFLKLIFKNKSIQMTRDKFLVKAPLFGHIVLNYNTAQVSQHFGTLFESGITIVKCIEITKNVIQNKVFRKELEFMIERIKKGASLSQSFPDNSHFPEMFIKLIRVGERTGKLPHVISYMKRYYKELVDNDVKNITTVIEPVIMVVLGLMVAGLVISIIGPIYQLISNVGT